MSRWMLTAVLVLPFVIVSGLFAYASGQAAHARARLEAAKAAEAAARAQAVAAAAAVAAAQPGGTAKLPPGVIAPDPTKPNMVRPESLPQGFVLVVKDASGLANANSPIFLASSHNGWDPSDTKQKLEARSDLRWQIVLPKPKTDAPLAFKFTRGNWDREELDANLNTIENRSLPLVDFTKLVGDEKPVIEFVVPKWGDQRPNAAARPDLNPYFDLAMTGNARRIQVSGGGVPMTRDVIVWLPPGYEDPKNAEKTYPVLYLQDGQNVFMKMPTLPDEWGADEAATELINAGKVEPMIIVGIPHAMAGRVAEYSPFEIVKGTEPRAKQYVEFVVGEVMPRVERAFRVKAGAENTVIGGASLGAVISLYAAVERPDKFGGVLLESMTMGGQDRKSIGLLSNAKTPPARVYFGMGGKEGGNDAKDAENNAFYAASVAEFQKALDAKGIKNAKVVLDADANHDEKAWKKRLPGALEFLFPAKK